MYASGMRHRDNRTGSLHLLHGCNPQTQDEAPGFGCCAQRQRPAAAHSNSINPTVSNRAGAPARQQNKSELNYNLQLSTIDSKWNFFVNNLLSGTRRTGSVSGRILAYRRSARGIPCDWEVVVLSPLLRGANADACSDVLCLITALGIREP